MGLPLLLLPVLLLHTGFRGVEGRDSITTSSSSSTSTLLRCPSVLLAGAVARGAWLPWGAAVCRVGCDACACAACSVGVGASRAARWVCGRGQGGGGRWPADASILALDVAAAAAAAACSGCEPASSCPLAVPCTMLPAALVAGSCRPAALGGPQCGCCCCPCCRAWPTLPLLPLLLRREMLPVVVGACAQCWAQAAGWGRRLGAGLTCGCAAALAGRVQLWSRACGACGVPCWCVAASGVAAQARGSSAGCRLPPAAAGGAASAAALPSCGRLQGRVRFWRISCSSCVADAMLLRRADGAGLPAAAFATAGVEAPAGQAAACTHASRRGAAVHCVLAWHVEAAGTAVGVLPGCAVAVVCECELHSEGGGSMGPAQSWVDASQVAHRGAEAWVCAS